VITAQLQHSIKHYLFNSNGQQHLIFITAFLNKHSYTFDGGCA